MTKEEFENIYRQHYAKMYCLARTMLYDADESKDVVSDIFARLLREKYHPQQHQQEGYLMTAVRNRCRDVLSHKSMRERVEKLFCKSGSRATLSLRILTMIAWNVWCNSLSQNCHRSANKFSSFVSYAN